ncbi:amidase [Streptomyces sp. ODS28]|uniref:amidase n=1 Tax=Streptomyces sp. ODS28 TaxID=3136688 RepID=UPI0031F00609
MTVAEGEAEGTGDRVGARGAEVARGGGELAGLDAVGQAELVRRGEVPAAELVEAAIERIERTDGELNAVITPLYEKALEQARSPELPRGPFHGVPMLLKDMVAHSAGDPVYGAMRVLKDADWTEPQDSYLAGRLREAGFVFCGKTNLPELATSVTTEPLAHGPTRNPWDTTRSAGGSSGGSAAAVAAGMTPVAHGNDMAGSIRMPASACGVVGLKPTRARTSLGPEHGEYWGGICTEHVLTRTVRDTAAVLDVLHGSAPGDPYSAPPASRPYRDEVGAAPGELRIGFRTAVPGGLGETHAECVAAVEKTTGLLDSLGHRVEPTEAAALDDPAMLETLPTLFAGVVAWELERWSERLGRRIGPSELEPMNGMMAEAGRSVTAAQWISGIQAWHRWARGVAALWEGELDILLLPTLPAPPHTLGELAPDARPPAELVAGVTRGIAFTQPFNITGQPAVSLPLHRAEDGLPIGIQLVAAYGREDLLLRVAAQLEEAAPWAGERPKVWAA